MVLMSIESFEKREQMLELRDKVLQAEFDFETSIKVTDHILDVIERLEEYPDSGSTTK